MTKKKLLFLLMALLMLASLVSPASAAETGNRASTEIEAVCSRLPEIRVTVPPAMDVLINPYKIPVVVQDKQVGDQIISDPVALKNEGEVPLKVSVSIETVIKEGSDMRLLSESTLGQEMTSKRAFIYFEIQAADDPDAVAWDEKYSDEKHLVIRPGTKIRKDIVTLGADGQPLSYGAFRLTGDCVEAPRSPWTEADGIDVSIAFTFKATEIAP